MQMAPQNQAVIGSMFHSDTGNLFISLLFSSVLYSISIQVPFSITSAYHFTVSYFNLLVLSPVSNHYVSSFCVFSVSFFCTLAHHLLVLISCLHLF